MCLSSYNKDYRSVSPFVTEIISLPMSHSA